MNSYVDHAQFTLAPACTHVWTVHYTIVRRVIEHEPSFFPVLKSVDYIFVNFYLVIPPRHIQLATRISWEFLGFIFSIFQWV